MTNVDDLFTRIDLSLIEPKFLYNAKLLVAGLRDAGVDFYAISGFRSNEDQAALYAVGRSRRGKIVTNAKPGESFHNYGLAIDFCRDADAQRSRLQPDYKFEDYKLLADAATKLGLTPGYSFKSFPEGPHIQASLKISLAQMQTLGTAAIWASISVG